MPDQPDEVEGLSTLRDALQLSRTEFLRRVREHNATTHNTQPPPVVERSAAMPAFNPDCYCNEDCHGSCCCDCPCGCVGTPERPRPAEDEWDYPPRPTSRRRSMPRLMSYSYQPDIEFHGNSPLQFGMECELSSDDTYPILAAQDLLGDLACYKSDGSVNGFEMVTQPMDYDYWMTQFPWQVFPTLANEGCRVVPSTNGIHVHLSRRGFSSPAHVYRWMKLLYRNQSSVERIARRRDTSWAPFESGHRKGQFQHVYKKLPRPVPVPECFAITTLSESSYMNRYSSSSRTRQLRPEYVAAILDITDQHSPYSLDLSSRLTPDVVRDYRGRSFFYLSAIDRYIRVIEMRPLTDIPADSLARSAAYCDYLLASNPGNMSNDPTQATRYSAINTTNDHTYEVRLFAATTNAHEAKTVIQFCAASVEYTRNLSAHQVVSGGWNWDAFREWVQVPDTVYPDLSRALDAKINWTQAKYVYPATARIASV